MTTSLDRKLSLGLVFVFGAFLAAAAANLDLHFDASYNLVSWQNLALGKGFVHDYAGERVPFNPDISTGPALYLPAFLIWVASGTTSYWAAAYVVVGYYLAFFVFLLFVVLKDAPGRFLALLLFAVLFFCLNLLLTEGFFVHPLGETVSVMFILAGIYLLVVRRMYLPAFLVIGIGLDLKTNHIIAVLPVLGLVFLLEHVKPAFATGRPDRKALLRSARLFVVGTAIMLAPHLVHTKLLPELMLSGQDEAVWAEARRERWNYLVKNGFSHLRDARKEKKGGWTTYRERLGEKIEIARGYLGGSSWAAYVYALLVLVIAGIAYRERHFSFYLVVFSGCIYGWWLFAIGFPWYRYWSAGDLMFILALTTLAPMLFQQWRTWRAAVVFLLVLLAFVPRLSFPDIQRVFDPDRRDAFVAMAERLSGIDENRIFTWGWFQAPQFMLLSGKRFRDVLKRPQLEAALNGPGPVYLLTTRDTPKANVTTGPLAPYLVPVARYDSNTLYQIKQDARVLELKL